MKKSSIVVTLIVIIFAAGVVSIWRGIRIRKVRPVVKEEKIFVEKRVQEPLRQAFSLYNSKKYKEALKKFQQILSEPGLSEEIRENIYFISGECYRKLGYPNKAIKSYQRATTSKNKDMRMVSTLIMSVLHSEQGNIQKVIEKSEDLVADQEQDDVTRMTALESMVYSLEESGLNDTELKKKLKEIIKKYGPGKIVSPARIKLADVYIKEKDYDRAIKIYQDIIEKYPDDKMWTGRAKIALLNTYLEQKDFKNFKSSILQTLTGQKADLTNKQAEELIKALEASSTEQEAN